jgi:hypothetical protein
MMEMHITIRRLRSNMASGQEMGEHFAKDRAEAPVEAPLLHK